MNDDIVKSAIDQSLTNLLVKSNKLDDFQNENILALFKDKVSNVSDQIDNEIFEISKMESDEILESLNPLIDKLSHDALSDSELKEFKRQMHTLKGCVRMAGLNKAGLIAHRIESLLDYIFEHNLNVFKFRGVLEEETQKIKFILLSPFKKYNDEEIHWLDSALIDNNVSHIDGSSAEIINKDKQIQEKESKKENKSFIRIPSKIIDSAMNDAGTIRLLKNSLEDASLNEKKSLIELKNAAFKLQKMLKEIEVQAESQIQSKDVSEDIKNDENFDPLEFDRFTRLQELTRLMHEVVSDIEVSILSIDENIKLKKNILNEQAIATNNLMSELIKVRLVSVSSISDRFYRISKNTAKELNKKVSLEIIGEKIELDKLILDKIINPIEHILRNSIAHGIESPETRVFYQKNPEGKIVIEIKLEGNSTIINISDDGAGINIEKIKEIGIKKKLIKDNLEYTKDELINLIFNSGFSTADSVSQVAGRGVGMDVVKNEILSMGGTIEIETEKNIGTVFKLKMPVDVATNQAMLCSVSGKIIAIPALLVEEVFFVNKDSLINGCKNNEIELNKKKYPFYSLNQLLGHVEFNTQKYFEHNSAIKIKYGKKSMVFYADKILGTFEIIIKPMGNVFGKFFGILGGTVLGDGKQGLVVNPVQLVEHYQKNKNINNTIKSISEIFEEKIKVLVVDDSLTVRKASSKILERNNFKVFLAKDGVDALEQLKEIRPNVILSDIEMPQMDGFEFLKNVKADNLLKELPVIMITSRTAEKHKNHAFSLGASGFIGKPYSEEELVLLINKLINS